MESFALWIIEPGYIGIHRGSIGRMWGMIRIMEKTGSNYLNLFMLAACMASKN